MALANSGFNGTVTEADYAFMWALGGIDACENLASWAVTQGTGRQVSTAAHSGRAFAKGVISKDTAAILTSLSTPVAGGWFLICRHIDWATDTVTIVALAHTTTTTTIPTAPPTGLPTMSTTPGSAWDQPLAWAWVRNTDTTMVLFDLRALPVAERTVATQAALPAASTVRRDYAYYVSAIPGGTFYSNGTVWRMVGTPEFADATARDAAITAPITGMTVSIAGIEYRYSGAAWVAQGSSSSGTPTLSANITNKAGYTPKLEKNGNIVTLAFGVTNSAATGTAVPGSGVSVMTLPAGFRPTSNTLVFGAGVNNGGTVALAFTVDASGVVKVNPASALGGGADLYGSISFSVA